MPQDDRVVGRNSTQGVMSGQSQDGPLRHFVPLLLVPASAPDQLAGRRIPHQGAHHGDDLAPVGDARQVELHVGVADP